MSRAVTKKMNEGGEYKKCSTQEVVRWMYIIGFLDLVAVSVISPFLMTRMKNLGASPLLAGLIGSVYGAIQLFSSPFMGSFSDQHGRREVLMLCISISAMSYTLLGGTDYLLLMFITRVITGIFKHTQTLARTLLADIHPLTEQSRVLGNFNAFGSMGFIFGPTVGGHLAELDNGFFWVCFVGGVLFWVNFGILWWCVRATTGTVKVKKLWQQDSGSAYKTVTSFKDTDWKSCWDIFILRFFLSFSTLVYRVNFTLLLEQNFGTTPKTVGYIISFQGIISTLAGFLTGRVSRWYNHDHMKQLFHGSVLLTIALLGLTFSPSIQCVLVFLVLLCLSSPIIRVSAIEVTIHRSPADKLGSMLGLGQTAASFSRTISPVAAGITQEVSLYGPGVAGSVSAAIGVIMARFMYVHSQKKITAPL